MRSRLVVPVLLAACLVSAVALAASNKVEATFQSLSASGVTGKAVLQQMPAGATFIHASIEGLQPNTEYVSSIYLGDQTCGAVGEIAATFVSNPQGKANWNQKVQQELQQIGSISVQLGSDNSVKACAGVTP